MDGIMNLDLKKKSLKIFRSAKCLYQIKNIWSLFKMVAIATKVFGVKMAGNMFKVIKRCKADFS